MTYRLEVWKGYWHEAASGMTADDLNKIIPLLKPGTTHRVKEECVRGSNGQPCVPRVLGQHKLVGL